MMRRVTVGVLLTINFLYFSNPRTGYGSDPIELSSEEPLRPWLNQAGDEIVRAALFEVQGGHVYLRQDNLTESRLSVSHLRPEDRNYARQWALRNDQPSLIAPHTSAVVTKVAFSPVGEQVLTRSMAVRNEPVLRLHDVSTSRLIRSYKVDELVDSQVVQIGFSHAGRFVYACCDSGLLLVWKTVSGELYRRFETNASGVRSAFFLPDSRHIAVNMETESVVFDVRTGEARRDPTPPSPIMFPPMAYGKGGLLSTDSDGEAILISKSGSGAQTYRGHSDGVRSLGFLTGGTQIFTLDGSGTLRVWSREKQEIIKQLPIVEPKFAMNQTILPFAVSPKGTHVALGGVGLRVLDLDDGSEVSASQSHEPAMIRQFELFDWGRRALVGLSDRNEIYDTSTGKLLRTFSSTASAVSGPLKATHQSLSPDGNWHLCTLSNGTVAVLDVRRGSTRWKHSVSGLKWAGFNPSGKEVLALGRNGIAHRWDTESGDKLSTSFQFDTKLMKGDPTITDDGQYFFFAAFDGRTRLWNIESGDLVRAIDAQPRVGFGANFSAAISPDGQYIATLGEHLQVWDVASGSMISQMDISSFTNETCVAFFPGPTQAETDARTIRNSSPNSKILSCGSDGSFRVWNTQTGEFVLESDDSKSVIRSAKFVDGGKSVLSVSEFGVCYIWSADSGREIATMYHSGSLAGLTLTMPDGRFCADLEQRSAFHWIVPDEPFRPVSLELLARDYYEPSLLSIVLVGGKQKPRKVRDVATLNRVQPVVKIEPIEPLPEWPHVVNVPVVVESQSRDVFGENVESGFRDVHLFRDGRLVGYHSLTATSDAAMVKFPYVQLPATGVENVEFTAYAFNSDGVKSETTKPVVYPIQPSTRAGRAYVIAVGVDAFEQHADSVFGNLQFAARDADAYSSQLDRALSASGQFSDVVKIPLTSTRNTATSTATKQTIKAVFDALSGFEVDDASLANVSQAKQLQRVRPEDAVFIAFSTHGYTRGDAVHDEALGGRSGEFYLVPSDIGDDQGGGVLDRCISAEQLATWLRGIDAGEMVMIIDACQSAGSAGQDFKPGPMGSRGLGQLAYNKKMRILAASQATQPAMENRLLGHGLLSYTLLSGLKTFAADESADGKITVSEWLRYGEQHVGEVAQQVSSGDVQLVALKNAQLLDDERAEVRHQQPVLFDFTRDNSGFVLKAR